jgi:hypothetical protein
MRVRHAALAAARLPGPVAADAHGATLTVTGDKRAVAYGPSGAGPRRRKPLGFGQGTATAQDAMVELERFRPAGMPRGRSG